MVCSGSERGVEGVSNMEKGRSSHGGGGGGEERSMKAPLHNFDLPSLLKWGQQRQLRCMKLPEKSFKRDGFRCRKRVTTADGSIKGVREEIVWDLKTAADRAKDGIFRKEYDSFSSEAAEEKRRWDLRRRVKVVSDKGVSPTPDVVAGVAAGGGRRVGCGGGNFSPTGKGKKEKRREKLVVELTRKEMEDDFIQMVGRGLSRRPKKRPRNVQLQLNMLSPGLWLTEVTVAVDTYKVPEPSLNSCKRYQ